MSPQSGQAAYSAGRAASGASVTNFSLTAGLEYVERLLRLHGSVAFSVAAYRSKLQRARAAIAVPQATLFQK